MKKCKQIIAVLLLAVMFITPAFANWQEEANAGNIAFTINAYYQQPALDATFNELSWTQLPITPGDISYAWAIEEEIAKNHDFDVWMTYNSTHVFILMSTDTEHYYNPLHDGDSNAWQFSAVQVNLAADDDWGTDRLEFGIWRNSEDGSLGGVVWAQHPDGQAFEPVGGENFTVELRDGRLWYQVVVPVNTFLRRTNEVSEGTVIGLCLVFAQAVRGQAGHIHAQLASGCTGDPGKDAERFARVTLGPRITPPAPEVVEPDPTPEPPAADPTPTPPAPTPTPAPQTLDPITLIIAGAIVSVAGVAILKKKQSVR